MIVGLVVLAGGLGAVGRYGLSGYVQRSLPRTRPWGTAVVNLLGAFGLGVLVGLGDGSVVSADLVRIAGAGFLGGFTTFSTWTVESVSLLESGGRTGLRLGSVNVFGQLAAGALAVGLGLLMGHRF